MKTIVTTTYQCEVCNMQHRTCEAAARCESLGRLMDKGVRVGDRVRVLTGEGRGQIGFCESVFVFTADYHPDYAHTVGITAKMIESWGHRQLQHDAYEPVR